MYSYKLPVSGIDLSWRPLTLGEQYAVETSHHKPEMQALMQIELMRRRIIKYGDKDGCPLPVMQGWDKYDFDAYVEHVFGTEAARSAALRAKGAGPGAMEALEVAIEGAQLAANQLQAALRAVLEQARAAEAERARPLK